VEEDRWLAVVNKQDIVHGVHIALGGKPRIDVGVHCDNVNGLVPIGGELLVGDLLLHLSQGLPNGLKPLVGRGILLLELGQVIALLAVALGHVHLELLKVAQDALQQVRVLLREGKREEKRGR
jgi:hypothetical protein